MPVVAPGPDPLRRRAALALALFPLIGARAADAKPQAGEEAEQAVFGTRLSGGVREIEVRVGDSLASLGARHGVDPALLARGNALGPAAKLRPGQRLSLDNRRVVPALIDDGILVSVAQRMLFLFEHGRLEGAWPVAAGRPDWPTPRGPFRVANLQVDKPWIVPRSIQEEMRREGKPVLTRVEPGPDNPLGRHWIGLSMPSLGIHGTNAPASIHSLRSHGCIRMHSDDVAELFARVRVGTPGLISYRCALLAELPDGRAWVEVDRDAYRRCAPVEQALRALADARGLSTRIDWGKVRQAALAREGVARDVALEPPSRPPGAAGTTDVSNTETPSTR